MIDTHQDRTGLSVISPHQPQQTATRCMTVGELREALKDHHENDLTNIERVRRPACDANVIRIVLE